MSTKHHSKTATFAAKLAAFILNAQQTHVKCSKTVGFQRSSDVIKGVIPLLHMNISKADFKKVAMGSTDSMSASLSAVCSHHGLDKLLSFEHFSCKKQCLFSAHVLMERFVETIEFAYDDRKNGQTRARELASYMMWQHHNGIIPKESVRWCKGVTPITGLAPA